MRSAVSWSKNAACQGHQPIRWRFPASHTYNHFRKMGLSKRRGISDLEPLGSRIILGRSVSVRSGQAELAVASGMESARPNKPHHYGLHIAAEVPNHRD